MAKQTTNKRLFNTLSADEKEVYLYEKELARTAGLKYSDKSIKQQGSVEAVAMDIKPRSYKVRFNQATLSTADRFKADLYFSIGVGFMEYQNLYYMNGGPEYLKKAELNANKFITDEVRGSFARFVKFGLFATADLDNYLPKASDIIGAYEIGQNGKTGAFQTKVRKDIYNKIISTITFKNS